MYLNVFVAPFIFIELLTANKVLDNVIYDDPLIYQLWIAVLGTEYHYVLPLIPNENGKVEPEPGYNTYLSRVLPYFPIDGAAYKEFEA